MFVNDSFTFSSADLNGKYFMKLTSLKGVMHAPQVGRSETK
jgi:hypothetical protein